MPAGTGNRLAGQQQDSCVLAGQQQQDFSGLGARQQDILSESEILVGNKHASGNQQQASRSHVH